MDQAKCQPFAYLSSVLPPSQPLLPERSLPAPSVDRVEVPGLVLSLPDFPGCVRFSLPAVAPDLLFNFLIRKALAGDAKKPVARAVPITA